MFTFAMLTVNATDHPVMRRFHRPEDEKRMVVIVKPSRYDAWLSGSVEDAAEFFASGPGHGRPLRHRCRLALPGLTAAGPSSARRR